MQSDPHLVFDHWILMHFNNLHMKLHWDPYISGNEPYRALKIKMPKEKFVKNQNLKGYWDIFNSAWVTPMQTLEKNSFFFIFEWSPLVYNATKIDRINRFYNLTDLANSE